MNGRRARSPSVAGNNLPRERQATSLIRFAFPEKCIKCPSELKANYATDFASSHNDADCVHNVLMTMTKTTRSPESERLRKDKSRAMTREQKR